MGSVLGGIGSIVGGIGALTSKPKSPNVQQAQNILPSPLITPGFNFNVKKGILAPQGLGLTGRATLQNFLLGSEPNTFDSLRRGQRNLFSNLGATRSGLSALGTDIDSLRESVKPGFGELTESRLKAVRNAGAESIGNLRASLARRGVMGSSFAEDSLARTRLAIADQEQQAISESKIAEMAFTSDLIKQKMDLFAQQLGLDQLGVTFSQQDIANAVTQANLVSNELLRELNELGVTGNILNQVGSTGVTQAIAQTQLQLLAQVSSGQNTTAALTSIFGGLQDIYNANKKA